MFRKSSTETITRVENINTSNTSNTNVNVPNVSETTNVTNFNNSRGQVIGNDIADPHNFLAARSNRLLASQNENVSAQEPLLESLYLKS